MDYLFTVCGRAGSKGLPNKNISLFCGVPLVYYTLAVIYDVKKELEKEGAVISVALNTDSPELRKLVIDEQELLDVIYVERTVELGGDRVAKVSVICDTLNKVEKKEGIEFDYVIDLDITSPLRTVKDVVDAIEKKRSRIDTDYVYSLSPARKNPYFNQAKLVDGFYEKVIHADYVSRQDTPEVFDMNASIYVYAPKALREKDPRTFFNDKGDAIIMRDTGVLDIDCVEDRDMMEILARNYFFRDFEDYSEIFRKACEFARA